MKQLIGIKLLFLVSILIASPLQGLETLSYLYKKSKETFGYTKGMLMRTHAGLHVSRKYNELMYGSTFTFNHIAGDSITPFTEYSELLCNDLSVRYSQGAQERHCNEILVKYDRSGAIESINDGKKSPLVLSSIPDKNDHIEQLKKYFNKEGRIGIFTLNEQWECDAVGLTTLIKNNSELKQFNYTTPDFGPPSLIDLIRGVRDLENRDDDNHEISAVHCKAGRGRSATLLGSYLAHVIYKTGIIPTAEEIEQYLKARRPQVSIHNEQKEVLKQFITELSLATSFEALYEKYKTEVIQRDEEVINSR